MLDLLKKGIQVIRFIFKNENTIYLTFFFAFAMTLSLSLFTLILPIIFSNIINALSNKTTSATSLLPYILLGYGLLWMLNQIIENIRYITLMYLIEGTMKAANLSLFDHFHTLSMRFHVHKQMGSLMNIINRAQYGLETLFFSIFFFAIPLLLEMTILFFIAFYFSPLLSISLLLIGFIYIFLSSILLKKSEYLHTEYSAKRVEATSAIHDSLAHIETVRIFNNQKFDHQKITALLVNQEKIGYDKHVFDAWFNVIQSVIIGCIFTIVTFSTGVSVTNGTYALKDFILINSYLMQFIMFLRSSYMIQQIRKGLHDIALVYDAIQIKPEIIDHPNALHLTAKNAEIVFDHVSFSYDIQRPIIKDISFIVPAGKTVALVGPSGAGKSTLAHLLFRFYDVTNGTIKINDTDIMDITQESLQGIIGLVPQHTTLFNDTLKNNLLYGKPNTTLEELHAAVKHAQLEQFIQTLPNGYDTFVGYEGLQLSGGERQRVAIARLLLKNPSLYIFDEATSALDSNTERELIKTIQTISSNKTTIIIAHRLSTIIHADVIIVLKDGIIVEQGSHSELLNNKNVYAQLWNVQRGT